MNEKDFEIAELKERLKLKEDELKGIWEVFDKLVEVIKELKN